MIKNGKVIKHNTYKFNLNYLWTNLNKILDRTGSIFIKVTIFYLICNAAAWFLLQFLHQKTPDIIVYGQIKHYLKDVFPEMSDMQVKQLLSESFNRKFDYEPFTGFKESSFSGSFVNISSTGFRLSKNQGPWPPDEKNLNIFLFGGSTTFNYGVSDDQTIASYLQMKLKKTTEKIVCVYNFGRSNYYSSQELILFERLVLSGIKPDIAIFIDGLNDFVFFEDQPAYSQIVDKLFSGDYNQTDYHLLELIKQQPLSKLLNELIVIPIKSKARKQAIEKNYSNPQASNTVIDRYLKTKHLTEIVAEAYDVKTVFVIQPVPVYNSKIQPSVNLENLNYVKYGYLKLSGLHKDQQLDNNILWAADLQEQFDEVLFVDNIHYSNFFSEKLAELIADFIKTQKLVNGTTY